MNHFRQMERRDTYHLVERYLQDIIMHPVFAQSYCPSLPVKDNIMRFLDLYNILTTRVYDLEEVNTVSLNKITALQNDIQQLNKRFDDILYHPDSYFVRKDLKEDFDKHKMQRSDVN